MRLLWFLLLLVLLPAFACAQSRQIATGPDSLGRLDTQMGRIGIFTYTGRTNLSSVYRTDSQAVVLHFAYNWIYNTSASVQGFVRNDRQLQVQHSNRLGQSGFWAGQQVTVSEYQANRTAIVRILQEFNHEAYIDSVWSIRSRVFAGIRRDERFGREDFGPEAGGSVRASMAPVQNIGVASGGLLLSRAQVGPRRFQRLHTDLVYASPAGMPASAEVRTGYYSVFSADYLAGNVQSIRSDTLFGSLRADYRINQNLTFRSVTTAAVPGRKFGYHQQPGGAAEQQHFGYEQIQAETENRLFYARNKFDASAEFVYRERRRDYFLRNNRRLSQNELRLAEERERIKDIKESHTYWIWNLRWQFAKRHTLSAHTTAHLLRLDTPSPNNNQDRDEAFYLGKIMLESRWGPSLRTQFGLAAETRQFIFVKAEQSIENYTDRMLRWEPGFNWVQGPFSWNAVLQVWAAYHVRVADTEQLKNRSTRTYTQVHDMAYRLPRSFRLIANYTRRESRTGLLNWSTFRESPLDTLVSHDLALMLEKRMAKPGGQTVMRAGYRLFHQGQHRTTGRAGDNGISTIYLREITRQHGPEFMLSHQRNDYLDISGSLWLQYVDTYNRFRSSSEPYLGNVISEEQLSQNRQALYPYFTVSVNWYFGRLLR